MKVVRPLFRENIEWRRLTRGERKGKPWKYILLKDIFIECKTGVTRHYDCVGKDGYVYGSILPHGVLISRLYAWNGNTGAPDSIFGLLLLLASLPHDLLFQFSGCSGFPSEITLSWTNALYFALSPKLTGWAYWSGLFMFSWILWAVLPKDGEYVTNYPLFLDEPT
jgi:hypothetical protein